MCLVGRNLSFIAKGCAMLQQKSKSLQDKILCYHEYIPLLHPCIFIVKCWSILQRKTNHCIINDKSYAQWITSLGGGRGWRWWSTTNRRAVRCNDRGAAVSSGGGGTSDCRRRLGAPPQPRGVSGQLVRLEGVGYWRWRRQADGRWVCIRARGEVWRRSRMIGHGVGRSIIKRFYCHGRGFCCSN
jgi:hypothetical protein